jgi:catechol 2,3-dioxygenase-like lactoylglutathione lyase family enzyme
MIEGLSHITLIVRDPDDMAEILKTVFDAEEIYDSGPQHFSLSREKFFLIGGVWVAVMQGEALGERSYNHIAFKVPDAEFDAYVDRIATLGLDMRPPRPRIEGEGRSIYFYDRDNHLFEFHTGTLQERLAQYAQHGKAAQ